MFKDLNLPRLVDSTLGSFGTAGIVVRHLSTGETLSHNADIVFPAASMIKLPILWDFFQRCSIGELDPNETHTIQAEELVRGAGLLWQFKSRPIFPLIDLATMMIVLSDNSATNILIDRLSIEGINHAIAKMGLTKTSLQRKMMDWSDPNRENWTSPLDVLSMFEQLLLHTESLGRFQEESKKILEGQQCINKFHAGLPYGTKVASKTVELSGVEHDAAYIQLPEGDFFAAVLTKNLAKNSDGISLCRRLAQTLAQP